ncbi:hypothetical protein [Prevotella nigrescens]|uniref:hypothetical protein n=1 Tax=Prevotella nigrescens TaxID=28133 RepID=UPI0002183225|nr:hypothetical protein [Prevotella nigrescens]EGQ13484.1 hypothetical protein HMPREF9419_1595 [Prevotella nigrescens ATCC 33563]UAK28632.1 hypothetical protein K8O81_00995 [Prevotella nigrescens]WMS22260.1 hypothetical protein RDV52_03575 [Prevotella nigrescens]SUB93325.1 Uncharacterised protein [Prevotella nigrescens]
MAQMGLGYGSEFQLLRFMGRHRHELERTIIDALQEKQQTINDKNFDWLDFEYSDIYKVITGDRELYGLSFLEKKIDKGLYDKITSALQKAGSFISNWQHWDAVFVLDDCFYFVEAKAYPGELYSTNDHGGSSKKEILNFMRENMQPYGIEVDKNWLDSYYQFANRISMMAFLNQNGLNAKAIYIYFENGYNKRQFIGKEIKTVSDKGAGKIEFDEAIQKELSHLNIEKANLSELVVHIYINATPKDIK